ncbi:hypothetical protein AAGS61_10265 [Lysinibacillus sp. KU-BSD001]|uniref:hypothetical protein n=1 Tax=Lysinibacillus sp. KU-BSD001 TaxID=3141328 RepID=UPI0036EA9818
MFNLLNANLYKARKMKTIWMLLALSIFCATMLLIIAYGVGNGKMDTSVSSIGFLFSDMNMLTIIGAILATSLIGTEFETKNIHHPIISGYSRFQIVMAKAFTYWMLLIILITPFLIASMIALLSGETFSLGPNLAGFLSIVTSDIDAATPKVISVLIVMTVVYLAQLSFAIFLAFWLKKAIFVITLYYMFSALTGQIAMYPDTFTILNKLISLTPFNGEFIVMNPSLTSGELTTALIISIIFMGIMTALSWIYFRKAEVK